jgi:hypothetical protein
MTRPNYSGPANWQWARFLSEKPTTGCARTPLPYDLGRFPVDKALPWQHHHVTTVASALSKNHSALDMSDMGTGKTYCTAFQSLIFNRPLAIVCPKRLVYMWNQVCSELSLLPPVFVLNYEILRTGKTIHVHKKGSSFKWNLSTENILVFDEVHACRGRGTLNSKLLSAARKQGIPLLMLSATPATTPLEMKAIGYALGLHNHNDFWIWAQKHGCNPNPKWGGFAFPKGEKGEKIMADLGQEILKDRGGRMQKSVLGDVFPKCHVVAEVYELPESGQKEFEEAYAEVIKRLNDLRELAELPIVEVLRMRQKLEFVKVPLFQQMTEDLLEQGHSVVIFLSFTETITALSQALNIDGIISGETKMKDQIRFLQEFQSDERRVLIINSADPEGLSLHDVQGKFPRVGLISLTYHAIKLKQILGRLQRAGVKTESTYKLIFAAKTVEEKACFAVRQKLANMDRLTDGDLQAGLPFEIVFDGDETEETHQL